MKRKTLCKISFIQRMDGVRFLEIGLGAWIRESPVCPKTQRLTVLCMHVRRIPHHHEVTCACNTLRFSFWVFSMSFCGKTNFHGMRDPARNRCLSSLPAEHSDPGSLTLNPECLSPKP